MTDSEAFQAMLLELGKYSDLHDAEISDFTYSSARRLLSVRLSCENYITEQIESIGIDFTSVSKLAMEEPSNDPRFSNDWFPVSTLLDHYVANETPNGIHMEFLGMYGWKIIVDSQGAKLHRPARS
jgi:hypothetical protein